MGVGRSIFCLFADVSDALHFLSFIKLINYERETDILSRNTDSKGYLKENTLFLFCFLKGYTYYMKYFKLKSFFVKKPIN